MIFREKNFVFVHIPRTGGTSMEHAFNSLLDLPQLQHKMLNEERCYGLFHGGFAQHLTIPEIVAHGFMTPDEAESFFKFAFVRNPFERAVSAYYYNPQIYADTFDEMVSRIPDLSQRSQHLKPQVEYTAGVDFVGRFENMQADFDTVCRRVGLPEIVLPKLNSTQHGQDYRQHYRAATRRIIEDVYRQDFEAFGYEF